VASAAPLPLGGSVSGVPIVQAWDDYGEIGRGASRAHVVGAENGNDYLVKGRDFSPANPCVAANELIAARLAGALGLPVLDHCLIRMGGKLFFGSNIMPAATFYPQITEALFNKCENRERIYDVVAFDAWVANVDRNDGNLIVRQSRSSGGSSEHHLLILNDHSHCLLGPGVSTTELLARVRSPADPYVCLPFVRGAVTSARELGAAVDRIVQLPADAVVHMVHSTPPDLVTSAVDLDAIRSYLIARRAELRHVLLTATGVFPHLS
jgi:hypothetical protein